MGGSDVTLASALLALSTEYPVIASTWTTLCRSDPQLTTLDWQLLSTTYTAESSQGFSSSARSHPEEEEEENEQRRVRASAAAVADATVIGVEGTESDSRLRERRSVPSTATDVDEDGEEGMDAAVDNPALPQDEASHCQVGSASLLNRVPCSSVCALLPRCSLLQRRKLRRLLPLLQSVHQVVGRAAAGFFRALSRAVDEEHTLFVQCIRAALALHANTREQRTKTMAATKNASSEAPLLCSTHRDTWLLSLRVFAVCQAAIARLFVIAQPLSSSVGSGASFSTLSTTAPSSTFSFGQSEENQLAALDAWRSLSWCLTEVREGGLVVLEQSCSGSACGVVVPLTCALPMLTVSQSSMHAGSALCDALWAASAPPPSSSDSSLSFVDEVIGRASGLFLAQLYTLTTHADPVVAGLASRTLRRWLAADSPYVAQQKKRGSAEGEAEEVGAVVDDVQLNAARRTARSAVKPTPPPPQGFSLSSTAISAASAQTTSSHASTTVCAEREVTAHDVALYALGWDTGAVQDHLHALSHPSGDAEEDDDDDDRSSGAGRVKTQKRLTGEDAVTGKEAGPSRGHGTKSLCLSEEGSTAAAGAAEARALLQPFCHPSSASSFSSVAAAAVPLGSPHWRSPLSALNALLRGERNCSATEPRMKQGNQPQPQASDEVDVSDALRRRQRSGAGRATGATGGGGNSGLGDAALWALLSVHHNERAFLPCFVLALLHTYGLCKRFTLLEATVPLLALEAHVAMLPSSPLAVPTAANGGVWWSGGGGSSTSEERGLGSAVHFSDTLLPIALSLVVTCKETEAQLRRRAEWSALLDTHLFRHAESFPRATRAVLRFLETVRIASMAMLRVYGVKGCSSVLTVTSSTAAPSNAEPFLEVQQGTSSGVSNLQSTCGLSRFGRLSQPTDVVESYWLRDIPAVHIARAALAVQEPALAAVFTELAGESALAPQSGIAIAQELTLAGLGSHHATSSSTLDGGGGGSAPAATATSAAATTSVTGGGAHGNVALDAAAVRQLHQRYSILFPQARPPASAAGTSASTSNSGGGRTASTAASPPPTSSVVASRAARAQAREADYTRRVMTLRARLFALYTKAAPLLPLDSFTTASLLSGSSGRGADTSTGWSSFTGVGSSGSGALQPPHNQQHQRGGDDDVHGGDVFDSIGSGMAWREALRAAEELEEEEGQDAVGEVRDTHRSVNCSVKRMLTEEDVESESDDDEADGNDERHSPVRGAPSTRPAVRALLQKAHLLVQAGLDRSAVELLLGGDDLLRQPRRRLRHCRVRGGAVVSEPPASVNGGHSESTADGLVWDWEAEVNEETTPTSALLTPPEEAAFRAVLAEAAWHCGRWGDDDRESLTGFLPLHHHPMHDAFTGGGGVGGRSGLPSLVDHHGGALSAVDVRVARRLFGEAQVYNEEQQQQQHGMTLSPSFHEGLLAGLLAIESGDVKGMLRHLRDAENAVQRQLHPTSWLSTLVAAQALHDVRLCGDARRPCGASAPSAAGLTHGAGTMGLLPSSSTSLPPYWVEELCTPPSANLSSRNDVASTTAMELTLPYTSGGGELLDRVRHALCQLYGRPDWWAASVKARSRRALRAHQPQLAYRWLRDFERFCTQQGVGASLVSTPVQQQHAQPPRTATVGGSETTNTSWLSDAMLTALALTQSEAVYELGRPGDALALLQRPPPPPSSSLPSFSSPLCSAARFALRLPASMATSPPVVRHVLGWYESLQLAPLSELVLDPFLSKSASTDDTGGCGFLLARLCHRLARDIVERVKSHEYQQMRESVAASKAARAALESETVQMKSLLNDQQANEVRKRLRQLQLDIEREEGELRTVASNYALYRRSALNSYARYLQLRHRRASTASATRKAQPNATTSVAHPTVQGVNVTSEEDVDAEEDELHAVFGFVSLWLDEEQQDAVLRERPDGSASSVTENVLRKALESIPAVSFLPLFAQLAARLGSGAEAERLSRLVLRVALAYPLHTVWPLLALSHGQEFGTARDARAVVFSWDDAKVSAATRVLKELKKSENAFTARAVTDAGRLSAAYIELAFEKPSSQSATRQHAIAGTARLLRDVQGLCIPPPTFTLPSALTSYPRSGISAGDGVEATEFSSMAIPCVMRFQSTYTTPGGINLPKVLRCELSTGETVRQLLKSKDDLRQDALIEQVFALSNTLFAKDEQARTLHVATYNVVPLAPVVGVLQWMEHTIPFGEYLTGSMSSGGGGSNGAAPFIGAHERYFPHEPTTSACRQKLNAAGKNEKESTLLQIYAEFTPAMHFFFMERCASAQMWLALQQSYTRSVAASSIVGYLVGLGDRHGSNLLIHLRSAELVHIDLGIAFDQNKLLPIPELVPFRLTRNIVDGFGVRGVDGGFRARCQDALHVLRSRRELLLNILDALVHDPLATWVIAVDPNAAAATSTVVGGDTATSLSATTDVKDAKRRTAATALSSVVPSVSDGVAHPPPFSSSSSVVPSTRHQRTTPADAQRALSRVAAKLSGFDGGNEQLAVPTQVHKLIQTAQNPKHLSAMFAGWSPWL